MTITIEQMDKVRTMIQDALDVLNNEGLLDMKMEAVVGHASYGNKNATFKVQIATLNSDGSANTKEATDYLAHCVFNQDLKKEWLNNPKDIRGKGEHTIIGYKRANRKYPFLVTNNGKTYKMSEQQVLRFWK